MKLFAAIFGMTLASGAMALSLTCKDSSLQDGAYVATFRGLFAKTIDVVLFVPAGEFNGKAFGGTCTADVGADETAYTCEVNTGLESGHTVKLFSVGGPELTASVQPWSMSGPGKAVLLPCPRH